MSDLVPQSIRNGQAVLRGIGRMEEQCPCPFASSQKGIGSISFSLSLSGCARALALLFYQKSEIRTPALSGRKAGTDRAFFFGSLRGGLADPRLRAQNERSLSTLRSVADGTDVRRGSTIAPKQYQGA